MVMVTAALVALATTTLGAGPVAAASAPNETPRQFLARPAAAVRKGDTTFLLARLNPAVIRRYGTPLCRGYVSTLKDPTRKLVVQHIGAPGPFAYTGDGTSTTVPKTGSRSPC